MLPAKLNLQTAARAGEWRESPRTGSHCMVKMKKQFGVWPGFPTIWFDLRFFASFAGKISFPSQGIAGNLTVDGLASISVSEGVALLLAPLSFEERKYARMAEAWSGSGVSIVM